jgi:N-acetyl-alpha-D-muramate 1-phosphate uridylyltransferase
MFSVAILAGGLATRLRPITETIPKALIDVAGKPFIIRQLEYLRSQEISRVVLCIGHLGEMIEAEIGNGKSLGLEVVYSADGDILLGTGGALKKALPTLGDDFFVLYGDSFLPIDFLEVQNTYISQKKPALMTVLKNANQWDKSNVEFRDGVLKEYNKHAPNSAMHYIDYGLGVVNSKALHAYSINQSFDLADFYGVLSQKGQLAGCEMYERFYEIGSHSGLKETEEYFKVKEQR